MIHSFSFKNFFSFQNKATVSFVDIRKGIETENNLFCDTSVGTRLSKVMMLVGPNASGKTNALKPLAFLSWFVEHSFSGRQGLQGENEEIPVDSFKFTEDEEKISEFEVVFEHKSIVYKYILHLRPTHVIKEELYRREETQYFNYLFKRNWNPKTGSSDIDQRIGLQTDVLEKILRKNVSLTSSAVAIKNEPLTEIVGFWGKLLTNVNRIGKSWNTSSLGEQGLTEAAEFYNNNQEIFGRAKQFLKDIDLGLESILINPVLVPDQKSGKEKTIYLMSGVHKVKGKSYELPFPLESTGTKSIFVLLKYLLPVIEQGGIAVIDELELDLHPHTLPQIIDLFANPETNPMNSQLLFTSHSLDVLNRLEKEQVVLVQKNNECESELYRLDEVEGVRRTDNIYAKYMAGAYGAVPNM